MNEPTIPPACLPPVDNAMGKEILAPIGTSPPGFIEDVNNNHDRPTEDLGVIATQRTTVLSPAEAEDLASCEAIIGKGLKTWAGPCATTTRQE